MLLEDDMAVTDVAEPFEMSLAAISKHLGVLARAGLIAQERRGRLNWCKLDPGALRAASVWMQGFGQFEPVHLDDFERFLAAELAEPATGVGSGGAHEEVDDREDHDDDADKIDDAIHDVSLFP